MRNAPPISTISPRETITSRPAASVLSTRTVAAALLLTTSAASAPVSVWKRPCTWSSRSERRPEPRSACRLENPAATSASACCAASESGARPRLVWSRTPVALTARRRLRAAARSRISAARAATASALDVHRAFAREQPRARLGDRLARGLQGQRARRREPRPSADGRACRPRAATGAASEDSSAIPLTSRRSLFTDQGTQDDARTANQADLSIASFLPCLGASWW